MKLERITEPERGLLRVNWHVNATPLASTSKRPVIVSVPPAKGTNAGTTTEISKRGPGGGGVGGGGDGLGGEGGGDGCGGAEGEVGKAMLGAVGDNTHCWNGFSEDNRHAIAAM